MTHPLRLAAILCLALAACRDTTGPAHDLADARARWRQSRPAKYSLTITVSCFCVFNPQPVVLDVQGDSVVARRVAATGAPVDPRVAGSFPTVDGLFAVLDSAIARKAAKLDVRYDPTRGYPTSIAIDYIEQAADDEIWYTVVAFEAR